MEFSEVLAANSLAFVRDTRRRSFHRENEFDFGGLQNVGAITQHSGFVNCICQIGDVRIASCSGDKTIKIYSLVTYECEITINEHNDSVFYICTLNDKKLISCSRDLTIKIWEIFDFSYNCVASLEGHSSWITKAIPLRNNKIASCSYDKTIKIWNSYPSYDCAYSINAHNGAVKSIIEAKNLDLVVSVSFDCTLKFWNSNSFKLEEVVNNIKCTGTNPLLEVRDNKVLVDGEFRISVIDMITHQIVCDIQTTFYFCSFFFEKDNVVLLGESKGGIYKLNTKTFKINLVDLAAHNDYIPYGFQDKNNTFYTCSHDGTIKIWK